MRKADQEDVAARTAAAAQEWEYRRVELENLAAAKKAEAEGAAERRQLRGKLRYHTPSTTLGAEINLKPQEVTEQVEDNGSLFTPLD